LFVTASTKRLLDVSRSGERTSVKWMKYPADVLPLFVAEMDYPLAPNIAIALRDAIERSDTGYAWPQALRHTFIYPGASHIPFGAVAEAQGVDAVTLMSASKAWNIPGLKCAQMVAGSERVYEWFQRLPADVTNRVGHLGVIATAAAYEGGSAWLRTMLAQLDENRRLLAALLSQQLPQIGYRLPDATYLAWLDCRALGLGDDPAQAFIDRGKVALAHGPDFGTSGRGFARLNFATSPDVIAEAVRRMTRAVSTQEPPCVHRREDRDRRD
jgi:bifunctional pyridoxal-dependent enzyme with beta-cystathionase and maltose regulon repressor activities